MPTGATSVGSHQSKEIDVKTKFNTAVELVGSLPKGGSFQPSYEDASKVYGYFKQSKFGPCKEPKPSFLYVIQRAKWEAWSYLGDMPKEEAMKCYAEEIQKHYFKFTTLPEFEEKQLEFASTIVPFCRANSLPLPDQIRQLVEVKNKKGKEKPLPNGIINGNRQHRHRPGTDGYAVEDEQWDMSKGSIYRDITQGMHLPVKAILKDNNDGNVGNDSYAYLVNSVNGNGDCNVDHMELSVETNSVIKSKPDPDISGSESNTCLDHMVISVDANGVIQSKSDADVSESEVEKNNCAVGKKNEYQSGEESEEDIYCDSLDPDQLIEKVSEFAGHLEIITTPIRQAIKDNLNDNTAKDLINGTQNSASLLKTDNTPLMIVDDPMFKVELVKSNLHSTPITKYKREQSTDISPLSSASDNSHENISPKAVSKLGTVPHSTRKHLKYLEERKLCEELEKPGVGHRSKGASPFKRAVLDGEDGQNKQKHLLVRRARGSETDLPAKDRSGSQQREQSDREQPQAPNVSSSMGGSSPRPREQERGHESDTSSSSNDVEAGEGGTIGDRIVDALERLQQDMKVVIVRLNSIEERIKSVTERQIPWWKPYVPSKSVLLLIIWPVLVNIVFSYYRRKKRK